MNVLIAASEAVPFAKTGGLADVTGALLEEFRAIPEIDARLFMPLYRGVRERFPLALTDITVSVSIAGVQKTGRVWAWEDRVFCLDCPEYFDRPELYGTSAGDYSDNASRFIFFARGVLEAARAMGFRPDVVHCNDWQTGLIPLYLKTLYHDPFFSATGSVLTIHNLGYQGQFAMQNFFLTGLGTEWFSPEGIEFYGRVNFLKAGIVAGDIITTVSKTYSEEILRPEQGYGLDGILRKRKPDVFGIVNGIDTALWDPADDPALSATYSVRSLKGKEVCRNALISECGLSSVGGRRPIVAFVGRLSDQKGLDILLECMKEVLGLGALFVILGKGDDHIQERVRAFATVEAGRLFLRIGYDEAFARRIYAGSDIFLMPSRYEPCGLGQLIAMRYATVTVARRTGGLADTIVDYDPLKESGTGFLFDGYSGGELKECLKRAFVAFSDERRWRRLVLRAMGQDLSWSVPARRYIELYKTARQRAAERQLP